MDHAEPAGRRTTRSRPTSATASSGCSTRRAPTWPCARSSSPPTARHFCTGADLRASRRPRPGPTARPSGRWASRPHHPGGRPAADRRRARLREAGHRRGQRHRRRHRRPPRASPATSSSPPKRAVHRGVRAPRHRARRRRRLPAPPPRRRPEGQGADVLRRRRLPRPTPQRSGLVNRVVPADELEADRDRVGRAPGRRADPGDRPDQGARQPLARDPTAPPPSPKRPWPRTSP